MVRHGPKEGYYMASDRLPLPEDRPTLTVPEAGRLAFGLSRSASYDAAANGHIPTLRLGRKVVVPTAALRRLLGIDSTEAA